MVDFSNCDKILVSVTKTSGIKVILQVKCDKNLPKVRFKRLIAIFANEILTVVFVSQTRKMSHLGIINHIWIAYAP